MQAQSLEGGFADPALEAASGFRELMECMARPGRIVEVAGARPPAPLSPAAGVVLLLLCDADTPLHLAGAADCPEVRSWVGFHCGAPLVPAADCAFALGDWAALAPLGRYRAGTPDYPDRSATLIVELPDLAPGGTRLTGPGIAEEARLPLPDPEALRANAARFPLGLDVIFTSGTRLAALPRSTRIG
ncbi:phosphonate C-P lyase system protein PhnH [Poseidonocella sp. HB161398]|uniref:phosphonate C-P lyase system protein PhnH n=1 Tax=Poseidonocella sp. HB161398 TaxID=2320855 RepID=UPI001109C5B1|nr:phosphonate C-P lyase system protein PhnH [Poseidonocella sp. HB161398]